MSSQPIIDCHVHLINPKKFNYPWSKILPEVHNSYLLKDYLNATEGINIEKIVVVEASRDTSQYIKEADWIAKLAIKEPIISAIIAWAPIEYGEKSLSSLNKLSKNNIVKGIRRIIQYEKDSYFCLKPEFIRGVKLLADYDFCFEICINHLQLNNTIKLVRQCPNTFFILEHIGKPNIKNQIFKSWKKNIKKLSMMDNVICKISGLLTEAGLNKWHEKDLIIYLDHIIDSFGFDRILYGGDWPMILLASNYKRWFHIINNMLDKYNKEERKKFFYDNAKKFYKLS